MNVVDLKRDVVPVSEFRSNAASLLQRAQEGHKLVLTLNGRAAGVLVGVDQYQEMEIRLKELEYAIDALKAKDKGELLDREEVTRELKAEVERAYKNSSGR